jgi:hypothetical protein
MFASVDGGRPGYMALAPHILASRHVSLPPSLAIIGLLLPQTALGGLLRLKRWQGWMAVFQNTWRKRHPLYVRH